MKFNFGYKIIDTLSGKVKYMPLRYDTGVKVKLSDWDSEDNIPAKSKDFVTAEQIREKLETLYKHLLNNQIEITPELLKLEMDKLLGRYVKVKKSTEIRGFIKEVILKSPKFSEPTKKAYKVLEGKLKNFEEVANITLTAENLDRNYYLAFQDFCKGEVNMNNSVWGTMKNLNSVLSKIAREYKLKTIFNPKKELGTDERVSLVKEDKIYFDFEQVEKIIEYQPQCEKLKNVKLILLILVFSGVRYSDVFKVVPDNEFDNGTIRFRYAHFITEKNPTEVVVPFMKPLEDAFADNNGNPPYPISSQKFNEYVKELCQKIGFTEECKLVITNSDGIKKFQEKQLFEFVSSHIGRRTFISNFINVVPATLITKITGHQFNSKDVVFDYNKIKPLKGALLFLKLVKKLSEDEDWKDEFPLKLVG